MNQLLTAIRKKIVTSAIFLFNFFKEKPVRLVLLLILIFAAFLRIYKLNTLPAGLAESELNLINKILTIKETPDLWLGVDFKDGIFIYLGAIMAKLFGASVLMFRIESAIIGVLTVFLAYYFTRDWFNRQAGYFASFLMAISAWHITISRNIDSSVLIPFFVFLLFVVSNLAFRTKKMIYFVLAGLTFGLSLYVDVIFLFFPVLFILAGIYFYFRNKKFITAYLREITIAVNVFILVSIPYFIAFAKFSTDFLDGFNFKNNLSELVNNLGLSIQTIFAHGEINYFYNLSAEPLVDPLIFALTVFGIGFALFHIYRRKNFFLVMLFLTMLLPAIFTNLHVTDKLTGTLAAIFVISAFTLNYLTRHWFKTFPFNVFARSIFISAVVVFFGIATVYNIQKYFVVWANSEKVKNHYSKELVLPKE